MELLFESPLRSYLDLGEAPTWVSTAPLQTTNLRDFVL